MPSRRSAWPVLTILCCAIALAAALRWLLPQLTAWPGVADAWWAVGAPAAGALGALGLFARRWRRRHEGDAGALGDLPGQLMHAFAGPTIALLAAAASWSPDPLARQRPWGVVIAASALALLAAMVLRALSRRAVIAELEARCAGAPRAAATLHARGSLSIRPTVTVTAAALALIACGLIGAHAHCRADAAVQQRAAHHARSAALVLAAVRDRVAPSAFAAWVAARPRDGAAVAAAAGDAPIAGALALVACSAVLVAGILGWVLSNEPVRELRAVARRLEQFVDHEGLDLRTPLNVTSIDEIGDITAALGALRLRLATDVERLELSLREARAATERKTTFLAAVSHELRTPLSNVCGFAQALGAGLRGPLPPSTAEDLSVIHSSAQQLLGLLNDVLDLSIIESGQTTLDLQRVDVAALAREVSAAQRTVLSARGRPVEFRAEIAADLPRVDADPRRMRQVIENLLANAVKFTARGTITLRVLREDAARLRIEVQDTGAGISMRELPHIFDEYQQAGALSARRKGAGLGLAICRHLVAQHRGEIEVRSELGRGTTFCVSWPVAPFAERAAAAAEDAR